MTYGEVRTIYAEWRKDAEEGGWLNWDNLHGSQTLVLGNYLFDHLDVPDDAIFPIEKASYYGLVPEEA